MSDFIVSDAEEFPHFGSGCRVLVAEDNPANRLITVTMLERLAIDTDTVANGAAALAAVAAVPYDLVLMDMQMPEMDGLEATRRIRQLPDPHGRVPIVGVTANTYREDHLRCLEAGMQAVMTKPFRRIDLAHVMAPLLATRAEIPIETFKIADPAVWEQLIGDVGPDAAKAVIAIFLKDSRARLARIGTYLAEGDVQGIGREAHALKGSVELLGFERMTRITARLQNLSRSAPPIGAIAGPAQDLAAAFAPVEALCLARLDSEI